ncbi:SMI1/KNR4 family protein [Hahella sp. KA22]|nr:SMI1/KNR4 family protein [Hahella sp. KA22]QAY58442.1 SMI1/KNR4 family protein [Hahella sp. KA22]
MSRIEELEKRFSVKFPLQYLDYLKEYNGGHPEPDGFLFKDESDGSIVDRFFGVDVEEHSDLEHYFSVYRTRIPNYMFPIGRDPGGNLILIGVLGDKVGKIYFWDHEEEADGFPPDMSNIHFLADDLDEFLNGLYEIELD